jgi:hypothetical protein
MRSTWRDLVVVFTIGVVVAAAILGYAMIVSP